MLAKHIHRTSQINSLAPEGHYEGSLLEHDNEWEYQRSSMYMKHENKLKGISLEWG